MAFHYITPGRCHLPSMLLTVLLCLGAHRIIAVTAPPEVLNVTTANVSENSFTVSWEAPTTGNITDYRIIISNGTILTNKTTTSMSYTETGLSPGITYDITIYTVNENGTSSGFLHNVTTLPSSVSDFHITAVWPTQMNLSWTRPSDFYASTYKYTIVINPGSTNVSSSSSFVLVTGLIPGNNYTFTIYTVTQNGFESKASQQTTNTTMPSPVKDLNVTDTSDNSVTLVWAFSTDPNAGSYTYTVDGGGSNRKTDIKTNTAEMTALQPGTDYTFTVYAVTSNRIYSEKSNIVNATTLPSPVENLIVISRSDNSVTLMWTLSSDPNNNSYTYTVDGGGENKKTDIKKNTAVMTNLQAGVNYNFTVFAVTSNGRTSKSSNVVNATTEPSIVQGVKESDVSNTTVTLQWDFSQDINNKTYTYTVDCQGSPSSSISSLKNNSVAVKNLKPGEDYTLTVFAVTENGINSQSSKTVPVTTMPNAPENLQWSAVDVSEIYVNWSAPADPNEKYYDYHVIWNDTMPSENHSAYTNDTHLNIKNLLPGHLYSITVTSVIKKIPSVEAGIYTVTKPLSAGNVTVSSINNNSATIKWTLPNDPESIVSGNRVTAYVDGKNKSEKYVTEETCVLDGLIPGTIYTFKVESYAKYEISGSANRMAEAKGFIISYSTPSTITNETVPDPVTDFKCSKSEAYQITVYFVCPDGNYSAFKVLVDNGAMKKVDNCSYDVIIPNLQPAASYKIRVMTVATSTTAVTSEIICSTDNTGVIVGSIFGILLFFLLIALIVYFVKKRRSQKETGENMTTATFNTRRVHTIPKDKFKLHYETNHADSDFGFAEEYQELSSVGTTQSKRVAELPENRAKNRFINVLPYDHSRVKLSIMNGISTSDYINANYMPGYNSTKEFIASQGPLPNTTSDFWRMIWEHQVNTIVMLTNCMENGRVKCEHYWPLDYTPCTYGDITVTVTSETILSEWTIADFSIKHANEPGIKYVRHFHFTAWPDHGVPDSTSSIIQFRNLVREYMDERKNSGPTVVHCSAGVGRTGTLIALDYLMQQIEKEQCIGIYSFVEKMRIHRNLMVQTEEQYIFLNKCMVDLILEPNDEHIYENHKGPELVYENINAIRDFQRENA